MTWNVTIEELFLVEPTMGSGEVLSLVVFLVHLNQSLFEGLPGARVVKNLPANAGYKGSNVWSEKIPHALEKLNLAATTTELVL